MDNLEISDVLTPSSKPNHPAHLKDDFQDEVTHVESVEATRDNAILSSENENKQLDNVQDVLRQMNEGISEIATTIKGFLSKKKSFSSLSSDSFDSENEDSPTKGLSSIGTEHVGGYYLPTPSHIIPEVRDCSWETFKNHFSEKDGSYAVDTLVGDDPMDYAQREENSKRNKLLGRVEGEPGYGENHPSDSGTETREPWIHAVRLQSPSVIKLLASFAPSPGYFPSPGPASQAPPRPTPPPPPPNLPRQASVPQPPPVYV